MCNNSAKFTIEEFAMRMLLVLDHPYTITSAQNVPHQRSFTAAVAAAARDGAQSAGHDVDLIDLAADDFNPAMTSADLAAWRQAQVVDPTVLDYQRRLLAADHLVFAFPVWWEAMPAMTKGFLDRVLTKDVDFRTFSALNRGRVAS
jgi:putative NADPH-quinone reductase